MSEPARAPKFAQGCDRDCAWEETPAGLCCDSCSGTLCAEHAHACFTCDESSEVDHYVCDGCQLSEPREMRRPYRVLVDCGECDGWGSTPEPDRCEPHSVLLCRSCGHRRECPTCGGTGRIEVEK